jgi:site-specific DNA-methyltransferase (adenine-specific)
MESKAIKIVKSDCVAGLKKIDSGTVSLVFADPPYNLSGASLVNRRSLTGGTFHKVNEAWDSMPESEYAIFTDTWISESSRVLKDSGAIYVCASHHNLGQILMSLRENGFSVKNIITWEKPNAMPNMTRRTYTHSTEFIVWAVLGKGWTFNYQALKELNPETQKDGSPKMMRDVWRFPVVQGSERLRSETGRALHPTQKPEALVERCLAASTNAGELVIDPFSGSGTTAVVCARMGLNFVGFELDDLYVKASRKRVGEMVRALARAK